MSQNRYCFVGAAAPEYLLFTIGAQAAPDGYVTDMSEARGAILDVFLPGAAAPVVWTVEVVSQTAAQLVLRHRFAADGTDVPTSGRYTVYPRVTTGAGTYPAGYDVFEALARGADQGKRLAPPPAVVELGDEAPGVFAPPTAPVNTVAPSLSGVNGQGRTLTLDPGVWTGSPVVQEAYQWQRVAPSGVVSDIAGAQGLTYVGTATDLGYDVRCAVTGTTGSGSVTVYTNAIGWTPAQIGGGLYAYANASKVDGQFASLVDLSPRARTLAVSGSGGTAPYGSTCRDLNSNGAINFNDLESHYARDTAGDALTAAAPLHQRGSVLYWAGILMGQGSGTVQVVGTYDGSAAGVGMNTRTILHNPLAATLYVYHSTNAVTHINLASLADIRTGEPFAVWWEEDTGTDAWEATVVRAPRWWTGETQPVTQTIAGSFASVPNAGNAKAAFAIGSYATGAAGTFSAQRTWAAGACTVGASTAADKSDFLEAFKRRCAVTRRTPAASLPMTFAAHFSGGGGVHQNDAGNARRADGAYAAELAVVTRLAAIRGAPLTTVTVGMGPADSRGFGTGATIIGGASGTDFRSVLHRKSFPFTRVCVGPQDDLGGTGSARHFSVSGYVVRSLAAVFGHSPRSPFHGNRIDNFVGPGKAYNNVDVWHIVLGTNSFASGPSYWDTSYEDGKLIEYLITARRDYGDGKIPGFVLHGEPNFYGGALWQTMVRRFNAGRDALADAIEAAYGAPCETVDFDDTTFSP